VKSEELDRIERVLGLQLPADYRLAMLGERRMSAHSVVNDTQQLIALNTPQASAWPPHLFVFGHRRDGRPLFLNLSATPASVVLVEPETGRIEIIAPDFATFLTTDRHASAP
jgi:hypothetical protein